MDDLIRECHGNNYDGVVRLIKDGADVNYTDNKGNNALCVSIHDSRYRIIFYLLDHNANPNSTDHQNNPALLLAVVNCDESVVSHLLSKGANFETNNKYALYYAVRRNKDKIVKLLLESGAPVNAFNANGETALHCAIKNGLLNMIHILLKHGADPLCKTNYNCRKKKDYSGLDLAKRRKSSNISYTLEIWISRTVDIKEPEFI